MTTILAWIVTNRKSLFKAICGLSVGLLLAWCVMLSKQNKKLSESLEMAQNNIEAYLGSLTESLLANNVLKLDIESLNKLNDKLLHELDSVRKENKIKPKQVNVAATQTLSLSVSNSKGVGGDIIQILKDTTYTDSIKYNELTKIYYSINKDSVTIKLELKNTQYLYTYYEKEYKNKKSFLKRLFTLDFKKVKKYRYQIINTNNLLDTSDVRVVESIDN